MKFSDVPKPIYLLLALFLSGCCLWRATDFVADKSTGRLTPATLSGEWFCQMDEVTGLNLFGPDGTYSFTVRVNGRTVYQCSDGTWNLSGQRLRLVYAEPLAKEPEPPVPGTDPLARLRRKRQPLEFYRGEEVRDDHMIVESSLDHFVLREDDGSLSQWARVDDTKNRAPEMTFQSDDWVWDIYFRHPDGNARRGPHGVLRHRGEPFAVPRKTSETVETPFGRLWYYGPERDITHIDDVSGWNFLDNKQQVRSTALE